MNQSIVNFMFNHDPCICTYYFSSLLLLKLNAIFRSSHVVDSIWFSTVKQVLTKVSCVLFAVVYKPLLSSFYSSLLLLFYYIRTLDCIEYTVCTFYLLLFFFCYTFVRFVFFLSVISYVT